MNTRSSIKVNAGKNHLLRDGNWTLCGKSLGEFGGFGSVSFYEFADNPCEKCIAKVKHLNAMTTNLLGELEEPRGQK